MNTRVPGFALGDGEPFSLRAERVLVVGAGLLGRAVAASVDGAAGTSVTCSRRPSPQHHRRWHQLDVTDLDACRRLCDEVAPTAVVLTHGPSSVEWCSENPAAAAAVHSQAATNIVAATDAWLLIASTDNVFAGTQDSYTEDDEPAPTNAYGAAKLAAERVVAAIPNSLVLRASVIYGWRQAGTRDTFFHQTVRALRRRERLVLPSDQWTTPVVVDDFASTVVRLISCKPTGVLHLGGPDRVDRATWALVIAETFGLPADSIVQSPRSQTQYADRPMNSCLRSKVTPTIPALAPIAPRGVREAAKLLRGSEPT